ncbi:S41 family peptidase [Rhodovibrionaceae bacterium A322]
MRHSAPEQRRAADRASGSADLNERLGDDSPFKAESTGRGMNRVALTTLGFTSLLLVSCATGNQQISDGAFNRHDAERMFIQGYKNIQSIYIDEVETEQLVLTGLEGLQDIDDKVVVQRREDQIELAYDGIPLVRYVAPARADLPAWSALTVALVDGSRAESPLIAEATSEEIYEVFFDSVTDELDNFSHYASLEEAEQNRASRDGFGGIGVRIRVEEEGVRVVDVMDNTPASHAGLKSEDLIIAVGDKPTQYLKQRQAVAYLRGPVGSDVQVKVQRSGHSLPLFVTLTRQHVVPQTVRYQREGNVAYIRLSGFNADTTRSLKDALLDAQDEMGDSLMGYVLDMRNNPGGILTEAITVSDLFMSHGSIVSTSGRHEKSKQGFNAGDQDPLVENKPVVALVNGNSASAAEIVASALQDSGIAIVVGSNSYGKGTVQRVLDMPNTGELTLTWARFHAPSGYALHRRGVLPDICTATEGANSQDIVEHLYRGQISFSRHTQQMMISDKDETALEAFRELCPQRQSDNKLDLEVAFRLIEDPVLFARAKGQRPDTAATPEGQLSQINWQN